MASYPNIFTSFPDKIPVLIHHEPNIKFKSGYQNPPVKSYLVPTSTTIADLCVTIRRNTTIAYDHSIEFKVYNGSNTVLQQNETMASIYAKWFHAQDKCLHLTLIVTPIMPRKA